MRLLRWFLAPVIFAGAFFIPISPLHASVWSDPGFPTDSGTSCSEGTTGTTGLMALSTQYGSGDTWRWTGVSGDENSFSLTIEYVEGGTPFDSGSFFQFAVAFRELGELCSTSFHPMMYDWPTPPGTPPPPARFVALSACTPTVTSSAGSSTGTVSFQNYGALYGLLPPDDRPEFQILTLDLAPQTSSGTHTYSIAFVCSAGGGDSGGFDGPRWDIDWNHYLTKAADGDAASLPSTR